MSAPHLSESTIMNIAFATYRTAQRSQPPTIQHGKLLKHILRYLKHTTYNAVLYSDNSKDLIGTYYDADYTSFKGMKSTTGAAHKSIGAPIMWTSRK